MFKFFKRVCCAATMLFAAASTHAATDAKGNFIYLVNNNYWINEPYYSVLRPIKKFSNFLEDFKLYETKNGSNIYEGFINTPSIGDIATLLFYYELSDDALVESSTMFNVISLQSDFDNDYLYLEKGRNGVYIDKNHLTVNKFAENTPWWSIRHTDTTQRYRVDLNNKSVYIVDKGTVLVLINDDSTPDFDNLEEKIAFENLNDYVPSGEVKLRFYDIFNDKWLNPSAGTEIKSGKNISVSYSASDSKGEPFVIKDWKGGLLQSIEKTEITNRGSLKMDITPDETFGNWENDMMYVEFASSTVIPWKGCSDQVINMLTPLYRKSDGTYKGTVTVPDNDFRLRIISGLSEKGMPNKVLAPATGNDRELKFIDITAYSTADELNADEAGYWTYNIVPDPSYVNMWKQHDVNITVTPGATPSVKFEYATEDKILWIVGDINNWNANDKTYALGKMSNGGYYGTVNLTQGQQFKIVDNPYWNGLNLSTDDAPIDMSTGDCTRSCYNGMGGNFSIINWEGGLLYIYLSENLTTIRVSATPIPESELNEIKDSYYAHFKGQNFQFTEIANGCGIYSADLYNNDYSPISELRIFSKELPISPEEEAWEGSYALRPTETEPVKFDEFGVAEFSYIRQDYVTEEGCEPFRIDDDPDQSNPYNYIVTIDTNKNKVYVERYGNSMYVLGDISDNRYPTYETRNEFKNYYFPASAILDAPAGKLGFSVYNNIYETMLPTNKNREVKEITLTDGMYNSDSALSEWNMKMYVVRDWQGGKVFLNWNALIDMSTITELALSDGTKFMQTAPGSLIYKGIRHISKETGADYISLIFKHYSINDYNSPREMDIFLTSDCRRIGTGSYRWYNKGDEILTPENGTVSGHLGFDGEAFSIPSWIGEGDIDLAIDLNTMTLTGIINQDNIGSTYEAVADGENGLDGIIGYPSSVQEDAVVLSASVSHTGEGGSAFNFVSPEGGVIAPASGNDVVVNFDAAGVWTGDYQSSYRSNSRRGARARAAQDAKWIINMPEGASTNLDILIDEANGKITIASSAHCDGYFILPCIQPGQPETALCVENIDKLRQQMLLPAGNGIYTGVCEFDTNAEGENQYVSFAGSVQGNNCIMIFTDYPDDYKLFDFSDSNKVTKLALSNYDYLMPWVVKGNPGKLNISYDKNNCLLTIEKDLSGVEDIIIDTDGYDPNAPVEYYNLQGIRVDNPSNGVYIRRQGNSATKVLIR